jgi:23S rRNA (cytosine1962-C5)-methyltransferase
MSPVRRPRPAARTRSTEPFSRPGRYRLTADAARRLSLGHPWVFREALGGRALAEPTGSLVEMQGGNHVFVARGFVDREHTIIARVLSRNPDEAVHPGAGAIGGRFQRALQLRWLVFGGSRGASLVASRVASLVASRAASLVASRAEYGQGERPLPAAMRLFYGDSEGLPGVNVDRYADFVVVQWLSAGALPWREELYDAIEKSLHPAAIYEQRRLRPLAGQAPPEPAVRARGREAPLEVIVEESGCRFAVDVTAPLGVGFFPDLRAGRDAVAARAADRRVLNLFSYTGAFSVRAAVAGAREVVAVDTMAKAHARARRNCELSGIDPGRIEAITADVGKTLDRFDSLGRRFDLVICDPPTFSHSPSAGPAFSVSRDLGNLAAACLRVLEPGGLLAFSTNASKLQAADVERALAEGAAQARCSAWIVERLGLPPDYPVAPGFPEGNYLKFYLLARST